jgi:signal transduction histidine kinase
MEFVTRLASSGARDVGELMARTLQDPSIRLAFRESPNNPVAAAGSAVDVRPGNAGREVATVENESLPIAAVFFDARLAEQAPVVRAAGETAAIWIESSRLRGELAASTRELLISRRRLLNAAVTERERIQRDFHDGAQQRLVGIRVKLDLAIEDLSQGQELGRETLVAIQRELEETITEVRALVSGVYPELLIDYGLSRALRAACRRSPVPVALRVERIRRYSRDVEAAVYFTCLEALQNVAKHAGPRARGVLHVRQDREQLRFALSDSGDGFDVERTPSGHGLVGMRDRIQALGGELTVTSAQGIGTVVSGSVPVHPDQPDEDAGVSGGRLTLGFEQQDVR